MDQRFGNLRYRTRNVGVVAPHGQNVKVGRFSVYNVADGTEHPDSGDLFTRPIISGFAGNEEERTWDALHQGPPYISGGPFSSLKITTPNLLVQGAGSWELGQYDVYGNQNIRYEGGFANPSWNDDNSAALSAQLQEYRPGVTSGYLNPPGLDSLANVAYGKLRPKVSIGGLGQALAEFRETPRMLQTTGGGFASIWRALTSSSRNASWRSLRTSLRRHRPLDVQKLKMAPRAAGDHYLNTQFGWAPFVRDVYDVCNVIVNGHDVIARKKAKNGKWIQRAFYEDVVTQELPVAELPYIGCEPADNAFFRRCITSSTPYTITVEIIDRIWYKGQFKYYYPEFDDSLMADYPTIQQVAQYIDILGARIDPVLLYKITPWTWMVDWFTDVGAGVQRLQDLATDAVVSKYFYSMRHRTWRYRFRCRFSTNKGSRDLSWYFGGELKNRYEQDSPFGVNLKPINLSGFQLSILAALGLSHLV